MLKKKFQRIFKKKKKEKRRKKKEKKQNRPTPTLKSKKMFK